MNKCKKCGTEFEGKFCPQCGTPWLEAGEKVCPKCKAVLKADAKFCSECGYSFETQSAPEPAPVVTRSAPAHTGNWLLEAYRIVRFVPEVLFLLMSVLAFIFLAAPVTSVSSAGQFLGVMNVGNAYKTVSLSGIDGLRNPAIAFIVFAALGLVSALGCVFFAWRNKDSTPLSFGAFTFYLVYLIIGSVMIANTASLDEGLGVLSAGACPICFLVFSILFATGHGASLIAYQVLNKNPEVKAAREAKEEAEEARRAEFYVTHEEPVMKTPSTAKNAVIYKYEKRYYDAGKEKTPSAALVFFDTHKIALGITAAVLIVAIVLMATLIPYFNNKFRMGVVEKIFLGDSKEQVVDILGEPYGEDRASNDWFYYDDDLLSYVEKGQNLSKEQEEAIAQGNLTRAEQLAQEAKALQEQMNSEAFKCIEITFADNKVESVLFDTRYSLEPKAKEVEKCELLGEIFIVYYEDETVSPTKYQAVEGTNTAAPYEVHYTDGSYYKTYVKNGTLEEKRSGYSSENTFNWNDKYGSYSKQIPNDKVANVGTVDKDGVWSANQNEIEKLNMTEFVMPDGVISIGSNAFYGCSRLTSIALPDSVTEIGNYAFSGCSGLTSIEIPDSVTEIGSSAFLGCSGLKSVTIGTNVAEIGIDAFGKCGQLTNVQWNAVDCKMPEWGDFASQYANFKDCAQLSVTFGDEVKIVPRYAFYNCSGLTSVTIGSGVTEIGSCAFEYCSGLTSVTIGSGVTEIGSCAFRECRGLTSVTIGSGVTEIGSGAFYGCYKLMEVWNYSELELQPGTSDFGSIVCYAKYIYTTEEESKQTVTENEYIFYEDGDEHYLLGYTGTETALTLPAISPQGTSYEIYQYAFYENEKLMSVVIPDCVNSIGEYAFSHCSGLTSVTIGNGVTKIGEYAFSHCSGLTSVTIGNGVTKIGEGEFYYCGKLTSVTIPDSVTLIGKSAFEGCSGLTSIVIPDGVTEIGDGAFYGCSGLTSIEIPDSVTEIGEGAFPGTAYYNDVSNWENGEVLYIGNHLIMTKTTISGAYTIRQGTKTIADEAFYFRGSLTSITIPDSLICIGESAFSYCNGLAEVHITDLAAWCRIEFLSIDANPFYYAQHLYMDGEEVTELKIPNNVSEIKNDAFRSCDGLTSVEIPDSVTRVGEAAFSSCEGLTSVTIGSGVTEIGSYAFNSCSGLTSVTIGSGVTSIGESAFYGCRELTDIQFKGTVAEWQAIKKGNNWNSKTGSYTVTCTDGTVKKDGTVTYFDN